MSSNCPHSFTEKVQCARCHSDDCTLTVTTGKFGCFDLIANETHCNSCEATVRRLMVDGQQVFYEHW